ncbi:hypothetical protein L3X38_006793 [Prunus dulcis]|uniref:Uncharacterized protein n=1 Tax=Prunus dulcis TaxID=3755 RepID=A0AAD5F5E8_PRUDU|nr:hypothetical protein L3X38_006793 [Prunus dulcis]
MVARETTQKKPHVAVLASPGMGHVTPLLELAKRLVVDHGFCEGESPSLVVFRCGTPLALLRVVICGDASLAKARGCRRHKNCMSQGNGARHEGAEGNVARHGGAKGVTIACRKVMGLGTRAPKA